MILKCGKIDRTFSVKESGVRLTATYFFFALPKKK